MKFEGLLFFSTFTRNFKIMIQRIQSLYLILATAVLVLMFYIPFSVLISSSDMAYSVVYNGISQYSDKAWSLINMNYLGVILLILSCTITFIAIFLFKNRKLQIKFCWISIVSAFLVLATYFIRHKFAVADYNITKSSFSWSAILPLISAILAYMALKSIKKDDDLVKSVDRIR